MTQPYPGPGGPQPFRQPYPVPHRPGPYQPVPYQPVPPRYRPLRKIALVSIVLMGLTAVAAVVQSALMWSSYDEVKRFVYGLLSEEEVDRAVGSIAGTGPLLNLVSYLLMGTAIAFLIWLWQARENTEFLRSPLAPRPIVQDGQPHRHGTGWIVGSWFVPILQFWYPLQIVQDVTAASEPPEQPGAARHGPVRTLLYGWWATWTGFWVILVGGGVLAFLAFIVWIVRLVDAADTADATGDYVDIYDLQDFMVRVALAVNIGFTVATLLLIAAGVTASLLLLRVTRWQHDQATTPPAAAVAPPPEPPQYAPRYNNPGPTFPSYGPDQR
ncbi:uncharacterized protein DUF4328 [Kribbella steppae]|uniref:Uncharacterized protein DUF4328 n=1 Tax=Kribbella steppae TaxID=2512223 RepID=A0A4R2HAY4_9ACTN|nr:DUF4328 domain-containing protein [Kribbella steppae]TCO24749.1 uncharacterized protein DUF4328 [Kribbella steppae]